MSNNKKHILDIILEEAIRAIIVIGIPAAINYFSNKNRKGITENRQTADDVKDTFSTDHDWNKKN